jgi:GH35 family endo-1,4-beta-xylanase
MHSTAGWVLMALLYTSVAGQDAATLMATANERIEKHRKGDFTIQLSLEDGNALPDGTLVSVDLQQHAFLFGANLFAFGESEGWEEEQYRNRFREAMNFATLPFYWHTYEEQAGELQESRWIKAAEWCKANGIATKGHPLVWNLEPNWVKSRRKEEKERLLWARISKIIMQYKGLIDTWDVVNEPTEGLKYAQQRNATALLGSLQKYGTIPVVTHSYKLARRANPRATLVLNDFNTSKQFEEIIRETKDLNAPFDVIGIQSHMHTGYWGVEKTWEICERFSKFGKPIHFTELTIISGRPKSRFDEDWQTTRKGWDSTPEGEKRQSKQVSEIYHLLFSHPSVNAISWWDLSDRHAWQGAPGGLLRKDLKPKHAYYVIRDLVRKGWSTHLKLPTQNGQVSLRGFYGDYVVSTTIDGKSRSGTFRLQREQTAAKIVLK